MGSKLALRESAQCPDEDEKQFQDVGKHKFFNVRASTPACGSCPDACATHGPDVAPPTLGSWAAGRAQRACT